ncbi:alpha-L-arabinofuranosidase C-terminal domain-containing protein [Parapedobacter soli]|uniref:alpha-L-arabinofuranosidase C-terminal domain-containing protein n=1 Tax=Parapedobacter soli TaxID=416955 RepID=UPI0021C9101C|nr:alpha-L-arabinofuranosidase C-terminal domain-containing protein [Parapedobacter soli]
MKPFFCKIAFLAFIALMGSIHPIQAQLTTVEIDLAATPVQINPMIYGQMLENVNDSMIYGGIADLQGNVRHHLTPSLRDLQIPVMRWPGGTVIHEYRWRHGIGPKPLRPTVENHHWGGVENYQFGTDEFLQWCREIGTEPYINFNMGNDPEFAGALWEALEWIEYVNGDPSSNFGKLRAHHGHAAPYRVKYWCIGNENYGPWGKHTAETETAYATKLRKWASAIKQRHPDLHLLGIGRSLKWNQTVLDSCGEFLDFLTQHYYVTSRVKDGEIQNPISTLFAPAKMEAHLTMLGAQLETINKQLGRADQPIRLSVDEWNNRHSVNHGDKFTFTRHDDRRQFDVAVVGGMLNAFIRQSPHVGMANYIFPVNAHGLIRTVGDDDAYHTPIYYVFKQYREQMVGSKLTVAVAGPSIATDAIKPTIDGDSREADIVAESIPFIDAAAVRHEDGSIYVSLVNRSPDATHQVRIDIPAGYRSETVWVLEHPDINARNDERNRTEITPSIQPAKARGGKFSTEVLACGLQIVKLVPLR